MKHSQTKIKSMKISKKTVVFALMLVFGALFFNSCKDKKTTPTPETPLATTALYDTLGWFIQGAQGAVAGNGTKMIPDPDNPGQKIQAGRLAIRTVVNKALGIIAADTALADYFPTLLGEVGAGNTTGLSALLESFTDFVQQGVSTQQVYKGKTMLQVHNHATYSRFGSVAHPVSDEGDFNQFVADVVTAAQSLSVPNSVIGQLGVLLTSVKGDVTQG